MICAPSPAARRTMVSAFATFAVASPLQANWVAATVTSAIAGSFAPLLLVRGDGHLDVALAPLLLLRHQQGGDDDAAADQRDDDGGERVDLGVEAEPDLREDHHRQRRGARPGDEARGHQVV